MAQFRLSTHVSTNGDDKNVAFKDTIAVAHLSDTGSLLTATILAGRLQQGNPSADVTGLGLPSTLRLESVDGAGENASFTFARIALSNPIDYYGKKAYVGGAVNVYAGATLTMLIDPRTNRKYLVVGEGSGHKIRLVDVTNSTAKDAMVTTVGTFVGPMEVEVGPTMDDVIVFDSLGVMSQLDLYPAVPCGNLWKFMNGSLAAWDEGESAQQQLLSDNKEYQLRRAAASTSSPGAPWVLTMQRKTAKQAIEGTDLAFVKEIACAKPKRGIADVCCVRKNARRNGLLSIRNMSLANQLQMSAALKEL